MSIKEKVKMEKKNYFNFDITTSKKNIGKYKIFLNKNEIKKIEKQLKKFLSY